MKKTHLWICSKVTDICMKSYWPDKFHSRQGRQGLKMLGTYTWPPEQFMFMHKCVVLPWTCPTVSGFRFKMPPHASAEFIWNAVQDSLNLQSIHLWVLHMCFQGRIDMLLLIWCCYSCLLSRYCVFLCKTKQKQEITELFQFSAVSLVQRFSNLPRPPKYDDPLKM